MYPDRRHEAANMAEAAGRDKLMPYNGERPEPPYPGKHEAALNQKLPVLTQEKLLAELHNRIDDFHDRLQAVLLPDELAKAAGSTVTETEPMASALNQQITSNNKQIQRAIYKVGRMIELLDV